MTSTNSKQYEDTYLFTSRKFLDGFLFFVAGGAIGAAAALLFAPKSGAELRKDVTDLTRKGYGETLEFAHQLKEQSSEMYNTLKEKTENVYDLATSKWSRADTAKDMPDLPGEMINGELKQLKNESLPKKTAGRRASNIL